jgi:hypothetical protein
VVEKGLKKGDTRYYYLLNSFQAAHFENVILRTEVEGLRQAITLQKRRQKKGKPLKNYLFDVDEQDAVVFSPAKIEKARARKAEFERQEQEEKERKEVEKALATKRRAKAQVEKEVKAKERKEAKEKRDR